MMWYHLENSSHGLAVQRAFQQILDSMLHSANHKSLCANGVLRKVKEKHEAYVQMEMLKGSWNKCRIISGVAQNKSQFHESLAVKQRRATNKNWSMPGSKFTCKAAGEALMNKRDPGVHVLSIQYTKSSQLFSCIPPTVLCCLSSVSDRLLRPALPKLASVFLDPSFSSTRQSFSNSLSVNCSP